MSFNNIVKKLLILLIWMLLGVGWYVYTQYQKKEAYRAEIAQINSNVIKSVEEAAQREKEAINNLVWKNIKNLLSKEDFIIVKDYFQSFENFYKSLTEIEEYKEKIKNKEFLESNEAKVIEKLRGMTLVSEVREDGQIKYIKGIPQNVSCTGLKLYSPCVKNEKEYKGRVEVVYMNKEYSEEDIRKILSGELKLFF